MIKSIYILIDKIVSPTHGLPRWLFHTISILSPLTNIEIFAVCKDNNSVILAFRDDQFYGPGWHLPGGIIRSRERLLERVKKTVKKEIKLGENEFQVKGCITLAESIDSKRPVRSHFYSFGYLVTCNPNHLSISEFNPSLEYKNGDLARHSKVPSNVIKEHKKYYAAIQSLLDGTELATIDIAYSLNAGKWD